MSPGCWICKHQNQEPIMVTTGQRNVSGELAIFTHWGKHRCALKQEDRCPNHCDFELNHAKVESLRRKFPDLAKASDDLDKLEERVAELKRSIA